MTSLLAVYDYQAERTVVSPLGAVMLGVCYYPEHWPEDNWAGDAARMVALGLSHVRIGEFAWSRIEPEPGYFAWEWLDRAVSILGDAGLRVILGTPTATPPAWLIEARPDCLAVGEDGRTRTFGSRRHYDFSSPAYRAESARIVTAMAERYGEHPAVVAWQTDNEYGCHDTVLSYSPAALAGFRRWLEHRYAGVDALNSAWGTAFWSQSYRSLDEVGLPNATTTEANPSHWLDFRRFSSDQVVAFNAAQVAILRARSPGRVITHNFMGKEIGFDHFKVASDLDVASWDSYPLGFTEVFPLDEDDKRTHCTTGHPDIAAFHHDLYRAVGRGRLWIMEQQPGPVNWAPWNPDPEPGMVRLWGWEALAHGAELVSFFRWRQCPFAQEQMHAGLCRPDGALDRGGEEVAALAGELKQTGLSPDTLTAGVGDAAIVFDYDALWMGAIQPQGQDYDAWMLTFEIYGALRRLGFSIDFVPPGASVAGYPLVVAPALFAPDDAAIAALDAAEGYVLLGPRSGSKTSDFQIPPDLPPGDLKRLLPFRVTRVESLRPGLVRPVTGGGAGHRWREHLDIDESVEGTLGAAAVTWRFADGRAALIEGERTGYLATWPDRPLADRLARHLAEAAGLPAVPLEGRGLRVRRAGDVVVAVNYGPDAAHVPAPAEARFLLGGRRLGAQDVAVWRMP